MKREFDRKIWKSGNSYVITIPAETVERFKLEGKFITVAITDEGSLLYEKIEKVKKLNKSRKKRGKKK
ncbi:hypothetical protein B6U80_01340 [Candidatus Pacearchaeota archaeon ex4484_26]|nr:MAG: hypothetical protein B6U80_01340 [Candidatus Pacearchaeota archaeon ex4484_26]